MEGDYLLRYGIYFQYKKYIIGLLCLYIIRRTPMRKKGFIWLIYVIESTEITQITVYILNQSS